MSGDPEQDLFRRRYYRGRHHRAVALSHLFVIARNSSFTYKGQPVRLQVVGEELGVHYVVEGSIRKAGNRVRVTVQLNDAATEKPHMGRAL